MGFYVIEHEDAPGCPVWIDGSLHENPATPPDTPMRYDWHSVRRDAAVSALPAQLYLITADISYRFDLVYAFHGYLVSRRFLDVAESFGLWAFESAPVEVVGADAGDIHYLRCVPADRLADVIDEQHSTSEYDPALRCNVDYSGVVFGPVDLPDLFCVDSVGLVDSLFCSQRFRDAVQALDPQGLTFLDAEDPGRILR